MEDAQLQINIQSPLVSLIDDNGIVFAQERITLGFSQQDTVGHQLDGGIVPAFVIKTDLITNPAPQGCLQLIGNTLSDRGRRHPAGLSMTDGLVPTATQLQAYFGNLCCFPRACLATDYHHLMVLYGSGNIVTFCTDWELFWIGNLKRQCCLC